MFERMKSDPEIKAGRDELERAIEAEELEMMRRRLSYALPPRYPVVFGPVVAGVNDPSEPRLDMAAAAREIQERLDRPFNTPEVKGRGPILEPDEHTLTGSELLDTLARSPEAREIMDRMSERQARENPPIDLTRCASGPDGDPGLLAFLASNPEAMAIVRELGKRR